jgi:AraC-like DNA-binding protein
VFDLTMDCRAGLAASWWRTVHFIQQELEAEETVLRTPLAVKNMEQTLIAALLYCQPHTYTDLMRRDVSPAAPRHVKRVEDFIDAHADEPIGISDLVAVAGVSARTLFTGFQRFRGTSPMKHLQQVRLDRARRDLETAPPGCTVTEVALRWGFTQLGRFAIGYRRRFGESPSQTLRRGQRRLA